MDVVKNTTLVEIKERYGNDWSNLILEDVLLDFTNLKEIILPTDIRLFQKISGKSIIGCHLPEADYSKYDFNGVSMMLCNFGEYSVLPSDSDFFQKIFQKSIIGCFLPHNDYTEYDFNQVYFSHFGEAGCTFEKTSILPSYVDLFQDIANKDLGECKLPNHTISNIHKYNLNGVKINLKKESSRLTEKQLSIIKCKYPTQIGKNIILPKKGLKEIIVDNFNIFNYI